MKVIVYYIIESQFTIFRELICAAVVVLRVPCKLARNC